MRKKIEVVKNKLRQIADRYEREQTAWGWRNIASDLRKIAEQLEPDSKQKGLYNKYKITKQNGEPVDPDGKYFVVRLDTDRHARQAVSAYAKSVMIENPELASDLLAEIEEFGCCKEQKETKGQELEKALQYVAKRIELMAASDSASQHYLPLVNALRAFTWEILKESEKQIGYGSER